MDDLIQAFEEYAKEAKKDIFKITTEAKENISEIVKKFCGVYDFVTMIYSTYPENGYDNDTKIIKIKENFLKDEYNEIP